MKRKLTSETEQRKMENVLIIYTGLTNSTFNADYLLAVAIVRQSLRNKFVKITEISVGEGDPFPTSNAIELHKPNLITVIGDMTLNKFDLENLWEKSKSGNFDIIRFARWESDFIKNMPGIRDKDESMSKLTWKFYNPRTPLPRLIELINSYIANDKVTDWDAEILPLCLTLIADFNSPDDFENQLLLKNKINDLETLNSLIKTGKSILNYVRKTDRNVVGWKIANSEIWANISNTVNKVLNNE